MIISLSLGIIMWMPVRWIGVSEVISKWISKINPVINEVGKSQVGRKYMHPV